MRIPELTMQKYPLLARLIFWAQKKKYGESLLPSKLWGRSPKLLYGLQVFYRALDRKHSPIEPALRALLNVKVAQINHCAFCLDIGTALSQRREVPMAKLQAINDENSPVITKREQVALAYADAMSRPGKSVDDALFGRLRCHFSDNEIIELTALIAYQNLSSKFNAALNIPAQGFCLKP